MSWFFAPLRQNQLQFAKRLEAKITLSAPINFSDDFVNDDSFELQPQRLFYSPSIVAILTISFSWVPCRVDASLQNILNIRIIILKEDQLLSAIIHAYLLCSNSYDATFKVHADPMFFFLACLEGLIAHYTIIHPSDGNKNSLNYGFRYLID